ncbi:MAG: NAD(P)/FAD-dependent oxidoreductase [Arsenophonus sp.]|nr:MAG: NAD(P)/FAD-dependent oxidoreductase [Arsenophonus sp.]
MMTPKTKIIIVGGGVGGLELATKLGDHLGKKNKAEIILIDCNQNHLWKPLLHEVAAGSLDYSINAISYLAHASDHYFRFELGCLKNLDRKKKTITLELIHDKNGQILISERKLDFDILVMALGSVSNDFSTDGVKKYCIFLDNPNEAHRFHSKMLNLFFDYENQKKINKSNDAINIAIVGGGATGVELCAELYNTMEQLINYGFLKKIKKDILNVTLIEAGERILPALPLRISKVVHNELKKIGVRILTKTMVVKAHSSGFYTQLGKKIDADLMVWVAGIKVADFMQKIGGLTTNKINQLVVKSTLQTTLDDSIFAIGDCACCLKKDGGFVPPRAQAAHQMATLCYKNILLSLQGKKLQDYIYRDNGSLVSLSHFATIGNLMGNLMRNDMMIQGRIARIMYILLYRMHQIVLHGYLKTGLIMLVSAINRIIRPKLKLY